MAIRGKIILLSLLALAFINSSASATDWRVQPVVRNNLSTPFQAQVDNIYMGKKDKFLPRFWSGVNLGSTLPGNFPGQMAPKASDYRRWFNLMSNMHIRSLRIFTLLPPSFYSELYRHNQLHPNRPIFLVQGVWYPENEINRTQDLWSNSVRTSMRDMLVQTVKAIHGDIVLKPKKGFASGTYTKNVSRWVLAWAVGAEWDPETLINTNRKHSSTRPFKGRYFQAKSSASASESWMALQMDIVAVREAMYGWSRPISFVNWSPTDPLRHPMEPRKYEDKVSLDANNIGVKNWPGGYFISYHLYPFYPDFMRYEYQSYKNKYTQKSDPFAGYLKALQKYHKGIPVVLLETGVPSGLGIAHKAPLGRDQGRHSEKDAADINSELLRTAQKEAYSGAFLFEWTDEWFKATWNVKDAEQPDERRMLWKNLINSEENFGILAHDAGYKGQVIIDGVESEWENNGSQVIQESRDLLREVRAAKDESALYLRLRFDRSKPWDDLPITIGIDSLPGSNVGIPNHSGVFSAADTAVTINKDSVQFLRAAWSEPTGSIFGSFQKIFEVDPKAYIPGSGFWVEPKLLLNRPYTSPLTGKKLQAEIAHLGSFKLSDPNPSLRLIAAKDNIIEIRVPWAFMGYSDPSRHYIAIPKNGKIEISHNDSRLGIEIFSDKEYPTSGYGWDPWNKLTWHERIKDGNSKLQKTFSALNQSIK